MINQFDTVSSDNWYYIDLFVNFELCYYYE